MNRIHDYQRKLDESDFLPLLPEQEAVAERIHKEMTKDVKASLISYTAWGAMFRPTKLCGEDAEKFLRQVKYGRPKNAAHEALERGRKMMAEYEANGFVKVSK